MKIYKIKNSEGLYSTGGVRPKWTKRDKTWSQMNFVKNHLRMFVNESQYRNVYENKIPKDWILEIYDFDKSQKEELECYSLISSPEWYTKLEEINKNYIIGCDPFMEDGSGSLNIFFTNEDLEIIKLMQEEE